MDSMEAMSLIDSGFSGGGDVGEVALEICTSPDVSCPIRGAFDFVRDNIGNAPNMFTDIVETMGVMGKPYMAFTVKGRMGTWNEVYTPKRKITVDLGRNIFASEMEAENPLYNEGNILTRYNRYGAITMEELGSKPAWFPLALVSFSAFMGTFFRMMLMEREVG